MFLKQETLKINLSKREKILIIIMLTAAAFFIQYRFLMAPQLKNYFTLKNELTKLQAEVQNSHTIKEEIAAQSDLLKDAGERIQSEKLMFSANIRDGTIPSLIGNWAFRNRIDIESYQTEIAADEAPFMILPVKLKIRGDYRDVLVFIKQIEEAGNLTQIVFLDVKPFKPILSNSKGNSPDTPAISSPLRQNGIVVADLHALIYSAASLAEEGEIKTWPAGRENVFDETAAVN